MNQILPTESLIDFEVEVTPPEIRPSDCPKNFELILMFSPFPTASNSFDLAQKIPRLLVIQIVPV